MIHLKNTCPELFQRTKKTLFLLFTIAMITFASGCCLLNKTDEPDNDFTFYLTQWPEGRAGAVSIVCNDYNVTDELFYRNSYALLQKYGFKASFFINSKFLKLFAEKPDDSVVWTRLKEYTAAGHEIGLALYIDNNEIQNAEDVLELVNDYRDLLKKRLNIDLKSVILAQNIFGQCDINWYWLLEKHGYFVNRYNFLRSQYHASVSDPKQNNHPVDPVGIGEEAERNSLWQQVILPGAYQINKHHPESTNLFTQKLLQDLKKRDVYVGTFQQTENFRRQRITAKIIIDHATRQRFTFHIDGKMGESSYIVAPYSKEEAGKNIFSGNIKLVRVILGSNLAVYRVPHNEKILCASADVLQNAAGMSSVTLAEYPNNARASLVFTFDDTNHNQTDDWYPLLKKYHLPATFFPYMKTKDEALWKKFYQIQEAGYEIGCHSYAHMPRHGLLSNLPPEEFYQDLKSAADQIKKYNLHVTAYCFPGNYHTRDSRNMVAEEYDWYVMNERNSFKPSKANFDPEIYCNYLLNSSESFVEMIHTPTYNGMDFIGMYEKLFAGVMPLRDKIQVNTYSNMRAYAYERHHARIIYLKTSPEHLKFKVETEVRGKSVVPLTVNVVPGNPKMLDNPQVFINRQKASYSIRDGKEITLSVMPDDIVNIFR